MPAGSSVGVADSVSFVVFQGFGQSDSDRCVDPRVRAGLNGNRWCHDEADSFMVKH